MTNPVELMRNDVITYDDPYSDTPLFYNEAQSAKIEPGLVLLAVAPDIEKDSDEEKKDKMKKGENDFKNLENGQIDGDSLVVNNVTAAIDDKMKHDDENSSNCKQPSDESVIIETSNDIGNDDIIISGATKQNDVINDVATVTVAASNSTTLPASDDCNIDNINNSSSSLTNNTNTKDLNKSSDVNADPRSNNTDDTNDTNKLKSLSKTNSLPPDLTIQTMPSESDPSNSHSLPKNVEHVKNDEEYSNEDPNFAIYDAPWDLGALQKGLEEKLIRNASSSLGSNSSSGAGGCIYKNLPNESDACEFDNGEMSYENLPTSDLTPQQQKRIQQHQQQQQQKLQQQQSRPQHKSSSPGYNNINNSNIAASRYSSSKINSPSNTPPLQRNQQQQQQSYTTSTNNNTKTSPQQRLQQQLSFQQQQHFTSNIQPPQRLIPNNVASDSSTKHPFHRRGVPVMGGGSIGRGVQQNKMSAATSVPAPTLISDWRPLEDYDSPWDEKQKDLIGTFSRDSGSLKSSPEHVVSPPPPHIQQLLPSSSSTLSSSSASSSRHHFHHQQQQLQQPPPLHARHSELAEKIESKLPLESEWWYHGPITRQEAESRLRNEREGSYLIRNSESNRLDYSLSIKSSNGCVHLKIVTNHEGRFILGQCSQPFASVPKMIQYYTLNKLPIKGAEHMSLTFPVGH